MRQSVVKNIASSAGRWLDVAPSRFPAWIADFAERHGDAARGAALTVVLTGQNVIFTAPDGVVAECHPPFPPVAGLSAGPDAIACAEAVAAACTPLPDGEASPDYLNHLVRVHARQALGEAFAAAAA